MNKIVLFIGVMSIIFLSGCSVKSAIVKVSESKSHFDDAVYGGQDFYVSEETTKAEQYRVFHQASSGFSGTSGIRNSAENRAKKFCQNLSKNKVMLKLSEHTAKPPYILGNFPRIEIIFACVDKNNTADDASNISVSEKLKELNQMREDELITNEEYNAKRKEMLDKY